MLELKVEMPRESKTIEWNKAHPTFRDLKERLRQCGIAAGNRFCVEVDRAGEFVTLDDNDLLDGPLIRVRASQIHNRNSEMFLEEVIPFVGRVFVLPKSLLDIRMDECTGTVGLVGAKGESVGAFHAVKKAWKHPRRYDIYIKYANHDKQPCFPAKILIYNEELDVFIAAPVPPFDFNFLKFLHPASGIAVGDTMHCLGFPKLVVEEALSHIKSVILKELEFPAVFTGNVCFSGWKQALADYRSFPESAGAILVDDHGRLKGIHVSSLSATEYRPELVSRTECGRNLSERTKELNERMNTCLPQLIAGVKRCAEAAVFVPISVLMESLAINPKTKAILYS